METGKAPLETSHVAIPFDPSLGNLSQLPKKIRRQIWEHFALYSIPRGTTGPPGITTSLLQISHRIPLLQTSHRIHEEVSYHIYNDLFLEFKVSPQCHYRSWLTVESDCGSSWHLQDLDDALSRGFGNLPYHKLGGMEIKIAAPDREDPGQIICLWNKCRDLSRMLEQAEHGLSYLEIRFEQPGRPKWSVDGKPQKSIGQDRLKRDPDPNDDHDSMSIYSASNDDSDLYDTLTAPPTNLLDRNGHLDLTKNDIEIVCSAFFLLRDVQAVDIVLPEDMSKEGTYVDYMHSFQMEHVLTGKNTFGTSDYDDQWTDDILEDDQDRVFWIIDAMLDTLPGCTANMLRLERFSSWYADGLSSESKYEKELERILKSDMRRRDRRYMHHNSPSRIEYRYLAMRFCNPKSFISQYRAKRSEGFDMIFYEALDLGIIKEEWDRDTWHNGCHRDGIPPFDTDKFGKKVEQLYDEDTSIRYAEELNVKLRGFRPWDFKRNRKWNAW
ncbi:MAG: hypothetical protein M1818_008029 [Claussenomyces sp. TS43310]|nr:MAG: hypothetical protein M1818_008029 [Claussenomyces sp. TS43310]